MTTTSLKMSRRLTLLMIPLKAGRRKKNVTSNDDINNNITIGPLRHTIAVKKYVATPYMGTKTPTKPWSIWHLYDD
jgi:hypothetical protein